jgi:hypothetical protein
MKKLAISVFTVALAIASAASTVKVNLLAPMTAAGVELKAGEYKVTAEGNTATFKSDKKTVTVPATVVTGGEKYKVTMMESAGPTLKSIHIGGTETTIVFSNTAAVTGGN